MPPTQPSDSETITRLQQHIARLESHQNELSKKYSQINDAFLHNPLALQITDSKNVLIRVNPAWCTLFGCSEDKALGTSFLDFLSPRSASIYVRSIENASKKDSSFSILAEITPTDQEPFAISISCRKQTTPGHDCSYSGILSSASAPIAIGQERWDAHSSFQLLAETFSDVVWVLDTSTMQLLYLSPSVFNLTGFTAEEILSRSLHGEVLPVLACPEMNNLADHLADWREGKIAADARFASEVQQLRKDGSTIWTQVTTRFHLNQDSNRLEIIGVSRDINQSYLAAQALQESEERFRMALEATSKAIWNWDLNNQKIYRSPKYYELVQRDPAEDNHDFHFFTTTVHPDDLPGVLSLIEEHKARKAPEIQARYRLATRDGSTRWMRLKGRLVEQDQDGNPLRITGTLEDITDRKKEEQELLQKDALLRAMLRNLPFDFWARNDKQQIIMQSDESIRLWGDLFHAPSLQDQLDPVTQKTWEENNKRVFAGETISEERLLISANGEPRTYHNILTPIREGNQSLGILGINIDITERKQAEQLLLASEERLRNIIQSAIDGFTLADHSGRIVQVNDSYCQMSGYTREEMLTKYVYDLEAVHSAEEIFEHNLFVMQQGGVHVEGCHRRKNGTLFDVEISIQYIPDHGGQFACFIRDITERKKAEEALRHSEEKFRSLAEANADLILRYDNQLRLLYINPAAVHLFASADNTAPGSTHSQLGFPPQISSFLEDTLELVYADGKPRQSEMQWVHNELLRYLDWRITPNLDELGRVYSVLAVGRDVTDKHLAEQNYQMIFNEMLDGFALHKFIYDADGNPANYQFISINPAFEKMIGVDASAVLGKTVLDLFPDLEPAWINIYGKVVQTGNGIQFESYAEELQKYFFVSAFRPMTDHFACIVHDITQIKQAEEERKILHAQLIQAQKMEAIGTLAGGIAHDFNNILAAIQGYTEMARESCPPGSSIATDLQHVLEASRRATTLVKQILAFSRQADGKRILLRPVHIVQEVTRLLRPSLPSTIDIHQNIKPMASLISADPTQIHQVLMNLCTNAFHAMEERGGTLEISLRECILDASDLQQHHDIKPGKFVLLSVADTGTGIPEQIRSKIFEPYFTTKEIGKGTGMGLAIVHGIVNSNGGFITCDSQLNQGTVFSVFLPASKPQTLEEPSADQAALTGQEHILFVDDEEMLAELGRVMLERLGYQVTVKTNSTEALAAFAEAPNSFDVIITDQTMPGLTGITMAERILQIRPDIPVILCTGHSSLLHEEQVKATGIRKFVMKPISRKEIASLLREILDQKK